VGVRVGEEGWEVVKEEGWVVVTGAVVAWVEGWVEGRVVVRVGEEGWEVVKEEGWVEGKVAVRVGAMAGVVGWGVREGVEVGMGRAVWVAGVGAVVAT
jgi:hypothetical protein